MSRTDSTRKRWIEEKWMRRVGLSCGGKERGLVRGRRRRGRQEDGGKKRKGCYSLTTPTTSHSQLTFHIHAFAIHFTVYSLIHNNGLNNAESSIE